MSAANNETGGTQMIEAALSLLESGQQKNELAEFYEQYKNHFFNIAYSKLHNVEESEDAVQETFLRVVDNPGKFFEMPKSEKIRFVEGIVRHVSIDKFNKNIKKDEIYIEDVGNDAISSDISPEEKYITDFSVDELVRFTLTLPEKQRQVLFMYVHEKLSYSEISGLLDISEDLARKRVSNARKAIKNFAERKK